MNRAIELPPRGKKLAEISAFSIQQHLGLGEQAVPKGVGGWPIGRRCCRQEALREVTLVFDVAVVVAVAAAAVIGDVVGVAAGGGSAVSVVAMAVAVVVAAAVSFAGLGMLRL